MIAEVVPSLLSAGLYAALTVLIGALGIHWLVLPRCGLVATERAPLERLAAGGAMIAAAALLLIVPARLYLQLRDFLEPGEAWQPALRAILFTTSSGKAAQLQMVWATAALLGFSVARTGRMRGWRAASLTVLVLAMTPGLGGHPAAASRPVLAMTVATMHVLAAGLWIGTLFHLWRATGRGSVSTLEKAVSAFHRVAQGAVGMLAVTGLYASLTTLTTVGDLFNTPWGVLLTLKLVLVAVALGLGAMHLRTAALKYSRGAHASVARTMGIELAFALAVIVLTGFLAGTAPPGS